LPTKKGRVGTMTHDYERHDHSVCGHILDGTVIGRIMQPQRHQKFIRFLNTIEG
jgi:hypothetical protein